ncbi:MAG: FAD:protein FMN transferase [Gammaproteobacteria bacterium]|nr:FAD:protein FMN transferase [Gammaproteobacteria bacterium]
MTRAEARPGDLTISRQQQGYIARFTAMACECELLMDLDDETLAHDLAGIVHNEARRIEHKFSRYRSDNLIAQINHSRGKPVSIDPETAALLRFADNLYQLSDGSFDITSGLLRQAWVFDGSDRLPRQAQITPLMERIGWSKVKWSETAITLPDGMEIDLGGIGKEYAVDQCLALIMQSTAAPVLVNLGGDLSCNGPTQPEKTWLVGVQSRSHSRLPDALKLKAGALATSGDMHRFLHRHGRRYSHILDPRTGWPVEDAPVSVTVAAPTCVQAGSLATLAMLQGRQAESWLEEMGAEYWVEHHSSGD